MVVVAHAIMVVAAKRIQGGAVAEQGGILTVPVDPEQRNPVKTKSNQGGMGFSYVITVVIERDDALSRFKSIGMTVRASATLSDMTTVGRKLTLPLRGY
ncbi:MAG: hypothetical protein EBQ77_00250 [Sphingobacteriia bacterium]|nr:hypothetical protein [Sphingobacteriia bacterium]